ncbi:uncharacterized protein METZ01_LOCUS168809, partial [marine metagenome]
VYVYRRKRETDQGEEIQHLFFVGSVRTSPLHDKLKAVADADGGGLNLDSMDGTARVD